MNQPSTPIGLEIVDKQLAGGFPFLSFHPALEYAFEEDNKVSRIHYLIYTAMVGLFIYDVFLLTDWQIIPDVFYQACINRLGIFTPISGIGLFFVSRAKNAAFRESFMACIYVFGIILIMEQFAQSSSPIRSVYPYGSMLVIIFANVVQRLRFRYSAVATAAMVIISLVTTTYFCSFDQTYILHQFVFFIGGASLVLAAAYALERGQRRSYLLELRGRLLTAQLDLGTKIDPLTGLWNRRHLNSVMQSAWGAAAVKPSSMAVILLDLDHFKLFNDSYGHIEGDMCLNRVSLCIRHVFGGERDVAVRFGGEEFLIFIPAIEAPAALAKAESLREALREAAIGHPAVAAGAFVTASIGVAVSAAASTTPSALMTAADMALYQAKNDGRDCIRSCVPHEKMAA